MKQLPEHHPTIEPGHIDHVVIVPGKGPLALVGNRIRTLLRVDAESATEDDAAYTFDGGEYLPLSALPVDPRFRAAVDTAQGKFAGELSEGKAVIVSSLAHGANARLVQDFDVTSKLQELLNT